MGAGAVEQGVESGADEAESGAEVVAFFGQAGFFGHGGVGAFPFGAGRAQCGG